MSIDNDCICPGDTVTYECTVHGDYGAFTLWIGDFIHCSLTSQEHVIELRHQMTNGSQGGEAKVCNNGDIVGKIVGTENGTFISQLNVTLTSGIAGGTIECAYDNGTVHRVGSLNVTKG